MSKRIRLALLAALAVFGITMGAQSSDCLGASPMSITCPGEAPFNWYGCNAGVYICTCSLDQLSSSIALCCVSYSFPPPGQSPSLAFHNCMITQGGWFCRTDPDYWCC